MLANENSVRFHELDLELHEVLLAFLGFERVKNAVETARGSLDRARLFMCTPERKASTFREHEAIIAAVKRHDAECRGARHGSAPRRGDGRAGRLRRAPSGRRGRAARDRGRLTPGLFGNSPHDRWNPYGRIVVNGPLRRGPTDGTRSPTGTNSWNSHSTSAPLAQPGAARRHDARAAHDDRPHRGGAWPARWPSTCGPPARVPAPRRCARCAAPSRIAADAACDRARRADAAVAVAPGPLKGGTGSMTQA